jgi:hypothetical protein
MKTNKMIVFSILFFIVSAIMCRGQDRGIQVLVKELDKDAKVGKQIVVLIAINKYNSWNSLQNPVKDAKALKQILEKRYYIDDFVELYDNKATKGNIIKTFNNLQSKAGKDDSLLIYYAGHGHLDSISNTGFWIPADAGTDVFTQENWIPNSQIRGILSKMKTKHVCLISDACFSGDILDVTRSIQPQVNSDYFKKAYSRVSRQVLTSGSSETVPDYSEFSTQLSMALENNTNTYMDPLMLYNEIRLGMKRTTPLLGNLKQSGHQDGASFIFFLKEKESKKETVVVTEKPEEDISITIKKNYGNVEIDVVTGGKFYMDGEYKTDLPEGSNVLIEKITVGAHEFEMKYPEGNAEKKEVSVKKDQTVRIKFEWVKKDKDVAHKEEKKREEEYTILPGGFSDDFDTGTLDSRWYWVRENPQKWSLTDESGYLTINPEQNKTNVLLTNTSEINFQVDVKLKVNALSVPSAGITVFLDDTLDDKKAIFLALCYDYNNKTAVSFTGKYNKTQPLGVYEVYLRLIKQGEKFTGFYSKNGKDFNQIGSESVKNPGTNLNVGLRAHNGRTTYFDYIRFSPIAE